jgi:hypothetical protein
MKHILRSLLVLPLIVLLTACPYESTVPITEANSPIDKALIGNWFKEGEQEAEYPSEYYQIKSMSPQLYTVVKLELNSEDNTYTEDSYVSHLSVLKGADGKDYKFLNMKKDGNYYLHKIDLSADQFVLYEVTDNIDEKFSSSAELMAFVKKHMHLSFFYNKDEVTYYKGN